MISTTSEHALRSLVRLARLPQGESLLGKRLAQDAEVPANYLSKILWTLGNAGLVSATRGSGGGYYLQKDPKKIFLIEVIELFEGVRARPRCLLGEKSPCSDRDPCSAHNAWREVRRRYISFLETTTLAQIARSSDGEGEVAAGAATPK